jgi:CHAT domain-containing protein/tetratricopeptide (TPR) repeat protein
MEKTPKLSRRIRHSVLIPCLCLSMALWCGALPGAVVHGQGVEAAAQSREFREAEQLNQRAVRLFQEGRYAEAIPLAERALALVEKVLGPNHISVAGALNNLASMYFGINDFVRAEPLFRRAIEILEKTLGPNHPLFASSLSNLAGVYYVKGDFLQAEPLLLRAIATLEKTLGNSHPQVAEALSTLAMVHYGKGEYRRAEPLLQRALDIKVKVFGPDHPGVVDILNNLGILYNAMGEYARAEPFLERSIAVLEKSLGTDSLHVASSLNNLAILYNAKGEYARAEPLLERALAIYEKALGPDHPLIATPLFNMAGLYYAKGNFALAVRLASRGNDVRERYLSLILATGSDRQKLAFLNTFSGETDCIVSLHAHSAPSDPLALQLSLMTILQRKGRALDAMTDQVAALRRRLEPQDRALLDQLSVAQTQLSTLMLGGFSNTSPGQYSVISSRLEERVERLQDAISRRSSEFRQWTQPVTIEQVRQALPPDSALVEFFSYRPFDPKVRTPAQRFGPARYVAYVLRKGGEPLWADLGEEANIDADLARLLMAIRCPQTVDDIKECPSVSEVKRLARAADERVMHPVRRLLGDTRHIFISPDGDLNHLPFAALVDEGGKYLIESYSLTYLTSGRDLLRLQQSGESREPPLVVADPAFGKGGQTRRSGGLAQVDFIPLPATAAEARALAAVLYGARVLTQAQATESALKHVSSPRVLHVATHGFFLPDQPDEGRVSSSFGFGSVAPQVFIRPENPLLRSGLAMAGANLPPRAGGEDDGILTALETAGLDLWGTKLVVLSACETGVGEVKNGEGVYGLRRALVLAGSESQVMSLWQVSDEATKDLMVGYYKRLLAGEGRTEGLRQVQLEMLRSGHQDVGQRAPRPGQKEARKADFSHPYYWAAFIPSGDWRSMSSQLGHSSR